MLKDKYLKNVIINDFRKTRLTKNHEILLEVPAPEIKHPKKDEEMGVKVEKDNIKYLIAVYRSCTNKYVAILSRCLLLIFPTFYF